MEPLVLISAPKVTTVDLPMPEVNDALRHREIESLIPEVNDVPGYQAMDHLIGNADALSSVSRRLQCIGASSLVFSSSV
jgi:hypothetical protein